MDDSPGSLIGRQVDQFRLDQFLARGALGMVFKAFDTVLLRTVAIRLIPRTDIAGVTQAESAARQEARNRLILDAEAARCLTHPSIATVQACGETGEFDYICMEYVSGRTLSQVLSERKMLGIEEALDLLDQILQALEAASQKGIVHRDCKPSNIVIGDDGRVKVMDFGIARLPSLSLTTHGKLLGTPHYMSPEQISGQAVDIRSDLFSAGAVLYEALTGERPFTAASPVALINKIIEADPIPARVLNIHVPEAVGDLLKKALAKDPADRFQTPTAMLMALRAVSQERTGAVGGKDGTEEVHWLRQAGGVTHPQTETAEGFGPPAVHEKGRPVLGRLPPRPVPEEARQAAAPWPLFRRFGALAVLLLVLAGVGVMLWRLYAEPVLQTFLATGESATVSTGSAQSHPATGQLKSTVDALVEKAKSLWETDPGMAQKLIEEACAADPNHFEATFQFARLLTFKKDFPAAIQQYQNALRINDQVSEVFFNLGYIYLSQGAIDQAIENYHACQALSPVYQDEVLTNLAVCHWKKNNSIQARVLLKQALELNPKNELARNFLNMIEKTPGSQK